MPVRKMRRPMGRMRIPRELIAVTACRSRFLPGIREFFILPLAYVSQLRYGHQNLMNRTAPLKTLGLLPLFASLLLSGCVNPIDPLGPIGKGPVPRPARSKPQLHDKFAWGISTASYQYEDPAVKPGQKDYFSTDWDILVSQKKAP